MITRNQIVPALLVSAFLTGFVSTRAAALPQHFVETEVASGLSSATAMAFAPDRRLLICQQGGALRISKAGVLLAAPVLSLAVDANGERGLLGVAVDPGFAANGFIYLYYTTATAPIHNRVSRFVMTGDTSSLSTETALLDLNNLTGATNHNGGALHFGPDGKLYIAVGENATGSNAQSMSNLLGKMLRMNSDGSIPTDNPFYNSATGKNRLIWALGLRNPYTFTFRRGTTRMFVNDVGQNTWEEINDGIVGANYGWPTFEGNGGTTGFKDPLYAYDHGGSVPNGCAITGGAFYSPAAGPVFPVSYAGKYFFADFCGGWLYLLDPATPAAAPVLFASGISSPLDLLEDDGSLFYLARGAGKVLRVDYRPPTFEIWRQSAFTAAQLADPTVSGAAADPERDGLTNLEEYTRGSAPMVADPKPEPLVTKVSVGANSHAAISYQRARGTTDVTFTIEASSDTFTWESGATVTTRVSEIDNGRTTIVTERDQKSVSGNDQRFLRLRVLKTTGARRLR